MKPLSLNLSQMKKIDTDGKSSTFMHPSGHKMVIAHAPLSALQRKQIEQLPVHKYAEGSNDGPVGEDRTIPFDKLIAQEQADSAPYGTPPSPAPIQGAKLASTGPITPDQVASMPSGEDGTTSGGQLDGTSPVVQAPNPQMPLMGGLGSGYSQGLSAIQEQKKIDQAKAPATEEAIQHNLTTQDSLNRGFQENYRNFVDHQQQLMTDYSNEHINPNHYMENMGAGEKVATSIGLLLGGFSTPFTHQGNPAMDFLNKQIDRDIQSQQSNMDKKKTLLGANQALFHDQTIASNQTRINLNDITAHKIQLAAAQQGTAQAKQTADWATAQFKMQNAGLLQQSAMRATALQFAQSGSADPAQLIPILVPKEHQAKAFGEVEAAENTRKMGGEIMNAFDQATKENTALKTGFGKLRTPGSVFALHQAMQPTFKDLEGTVRQAAMDNTFKNITPMPGDSDHTITQKRRSLEEYLQSKLSAPTARGYGIDLTRFNRTAPVNAQAPQSNEPKIAVGPGGKKLILQGGRWVPYGG